MKSRKIQTLLFVLCVAIATQSFAQKWTTVTCYPGIQLTIDTTKWDPQYEVPVHTDLFGAQLPIVGKGEQPKELLVYSFYGKDDSNNLKQAFMAHFPKHAMGLTELGDINGFTVLRRETYTYIALQPFSANQIAMVVFVAPNQKEKKSIKEFTALLNSAQFLTLEEMDARCGYPLKNYAKDSGRISFFSLRSTRSRTFKDKLIYVEEYMRAKFSPLSFDATVASEKDFSFSAFDKERQRLNKGEFNEQECLDIIFLPRENWRSFLYWELNRNNNPGYQSESKYNNLVEQSSKRYGELTGDTLSFKITPYPKELPWRHMDYWAYDFNQKGDYYRIGRTADAIHFYVFRKDNTGTWQKKHTELKRPFPNIPYPSYSAANSRAVVIDPDLILFAPPWQTKTRYLVIANVQKLKDRYLLPQFPSYSILENTENLSVIPFDYLPKEKANSLFIFPSHPLAYEFELKDLLSTHEYFEADLLYGDRGPYNLVWTNQRGEPISDEAWTKEELQKELLKIKAEDRYYFSGFYYRDVDDDNMKDLISGWFNNGTLILNPFFGADVNTLNNQQLENVFPRPNEIYFYDLSKTPYDNQFKNIMNREAYRAYEASKYTIMQDEIEEYPMMDEGIAVPYEFSPVEEMRPHEDEAVLFAQEMPQYPGGNVALDDELAKNINYPQDMEELGIQGKVYVSFVVERDGSLSNIKVVRGIRGGKPLDEEALRAVKKLSKKFTPGRTSGRTMRVQMTIPIVFKLNE
jgi:TonB family protein